MLCYKKKKESYTEPLDEQQFYELLRNKQSKSNIDNFRKTGKNMFKAKLPAICFQATFDKSDKTIKNPKTGEETIVNACWNVQSSTHLTGLVVLDVDHVENPIEIFNERLQIENGKLVATEKLSQIVNYPLSIINSPLESILLVFVTPSGKGLKIVFKANKEWGNLADNQIEMAELLGLELDTSGKDASRIAFICKEEDVLFINKELFTYEDKEFAELFNTQYRDGNSEPINHVRVDSGKYIRINTLAIQETGTPAVESRREAGCTVEAPVMWRGYNLQQIIDQRFAGKLPCKADRNRHKESLKLASDLLIMLDGDQAETLALLKLQTWVQEIIQERNEKVEATVKDAASNLSDREKKNLNPYPSKEMQAAIQAVTGKEYRDLVASNPDETAQQIVATEDTIEQKLWLWGEELRQLAQYYPVLNDVFKALKQNQYPASLFVAGSLMMTLMTRCWYSFYHRPEEKRRLNSSVIIEGDPACGKSFATRLYKLLMSPIFASDKAGKDAVNAYREMMRTKGANKEKPNKPKATIRIHPARTSNAQFIQDMVNSVEVVDGEEIQLHMITFDTELDNTLCLQKGGSWIDKISLELKAFHNEEDGQAYSNVDSVIRDFVVTWNYIYTGTPLALKKKVNEKNFGSGLATRLTCIPLPTTNFEMMTRENIKDFESDDRLKEWAFKLDKTKGELPLQKIVDALYDWTERRMADAAFNNSKADEMLLKRCAYHGMNFGAPFIVMRHWEELKKDGEFWCGEFQTDDIDWRLVELIVNMQYACQKHYFGAMAEKYFDDKLRDAAVNRQRQEKTVESYSRLPEEFTIEDVMRCFNLDRESSARSTVHRLIADKMAEKTGRYNDNGRSKSLFHKLQHLMY